MIDEIVGDAIDRVVSIEMRFASGLPRGVIQPLYEAARRHHGRSLCLLAAERLKASVSAGDVVLIATGAGTPPWLPKGETDGPLGAAALARAVEIGLGAKPIVLTEERNLQPTLASVEAAGLMCMDEESFRMRGGVAMALPFPLGQEAGRTYAAELFRNFDPKAVIFVEKTGPNPAGVFHSIMGTGRPDTAVANAHLLIDEAARTGALTIGIGDGGNEVGCGAIIDAVREIQPFGRKCQCPCGQGIATVATTDVLIAASISNWGAYGIAAALAGLLARPEVLHDEATELRMLDRCVAAGGMDGAYAKLVPFVDGTSATVQTALITMLHQIVSNGLRSFDRGF
jgi:hypothetical protein